MKKCIYKVTTLLIFASIALSSCSVQYRERHKKTREERHHDRNHDNRDNHDDHHYNNY